MACPSERMALTSLSLFAFPVTNTWMEMGIGLDTDGLCYSPSRVDIVCGRKLEDDNKLRNQDHTQFRNEVRSF